MVIQLQIVQAKGFCFCVFMSCITGIKYDLIQWVDSDSRGGAKVLNLGVGGDGSLFIVQHFINKSHLFQCISGIDSFYLRK